MDVPPQRRKVYNDFHAALSAGRVVKPAACEGCGKSSVGQDVLDAHHDDYSRPLDVRWLCRSCHVRHHDALRAAAGTGRQRADGAAKQLRPITNADGFMQMGQTSDPKGPPEIEPAPSTLSALRYWHKKIEDQAMRLSGIQSNLAGIL